MKTEIEKDTIYSIKLISGEEMVVKLVDFDDDYFYVNAPLGVAASPQGLQLMPALFTSDQNPDAAIPRHAIAIMSPSREDVQEAYDKSVNPTEIITPNKQIITG